MWFSVVFFFKQKKAYEWRISDGSSDVCSSDLCRKVGWSGIARRLTCGDDLYPALMLHGDGSPEQQASADLMHSQAAMTRSAIQRAELALHQIEVVRQAGRKAAGRPAQNAPRHRLTKPRRPPTN